MRNYTFSQQKKKKNEKEKRKKKKKRIILISVFSRSSKKSMPIILRYDYYSLI